MLQELKLIFFVVVYKLIGLIFKIFLLLLICLNFEFENVSAIKIIAQISFGCDWHTLG